MMSRQQSQRAATVKLTSKTRVKRKYVDIFKKPVSADEVRLAVQVVVTYNSASTILLQRQMKIGFGKAATLLKLLEDALVVTPQLGRPRTIILRHQAAATNAALRQLRKGNQK